jgi:hypothetical protein
MLSHNPKVVFNENGKLHHCRRKLHLSICREWLESGHKEHRLQLDFSLWNFRIKKWVGVS